MLGDVRTINDAIIASWQTGEFIPAVQPPKSRQVLKNRHQHIYASARLVERSTSAIIAPLPEMSSEAPVDALVGYHSGLFGPAMGATVRVEAAQRLCRAVHGALVAVVEGGDPRATVLDAQAQPNPNPACTQIILSETQLQMQI